jgi:hypothetical protein
MTTNGTDGTATAGTIVTRIEAEGASPATLLRVLCDAGFDGAKADRWGNVVVGDVEAAWVNGRVSGGSRGAIGVSVWVRLSVWSRRTPERRVMLKNVVDPTTGLVATFSLDVATLRTKVAELLALKDASAKAAAEGDVRRAAATATRTAALEALGIVPQRGTDARRGFAGLVEVRVLGDTPSAEPAKFGVSFEVDAAKMPAVLAAIRGLVG